MGHQANVKLLRGQVRIAVKELLPEVLKAESMIEMRRDLGNELETRLDAIQAHITSSLTVIDDRSKEVAAYVVRNSPVATPVQPTETPEIPTESTGQ